MMRKLLLFCLVLIATLSAMAQTREQQVLKLSADKFDWLIHQNMDSLMRLLDERVTYTHSNGWVQSRQDIVDDFKSGKIKYESVQVKDAAARLYDNAAIVTGTGTFAGLNGGNPFKLELRYTEVYVWRKGGWKLVSRHASRLP